MGWGSSVAWLGDGDGGGDGDGIPGDCVKVPCSAKDEINGVIVEK